MGLNAAATIIPGRGTVFIGAPHAVPPTMTQFASVDPATPSTYTGFECLGHTSRDNTVSLEKSGGDANVKGSWWDPNMITQYDDTSWAFTVNSLQIDYLTLKLAWPTGKVTADGRFVVPTDGGSTERSVLVFVNSGGKRFGWYDPRVSLSLGDAPSITTDGFFEIQLNGTPLSATEAITSAEIAAGDLHMWYPPVAIAVPSPTASSATPPAATTGTTLTVNGFNFDSATGVTVGGTALTGLVVVNGGRITGTMPSGSAGSAPIVVTTPAGTSNSLAYTRGA